MATPNVLILKNTLRENPTGPKGLNKHQFFKEPIQFDGYYFASANRIGLRIQMFVVVVNGWRELS